MQAGERDLGWREAVGQWDKVWDGGRQSLLGKCHLWLIPSALSGPSVCSVFLARLI